MTSPTGSPRVSNPPTVVVVTDMTVVYPKREMSMEQEIKIVAFIILGLSLAAGITLTVLRNQGIIPIHPSWSHTGANILSGTILTITAGLLVFTVYSFVKEERELNKYSRL